MLMSPLLGKERARVRFFCLGPKQLWIDRHIALKPFQHIAIPRPEQTPRPKTPSRVTIPSGSTRHSPPMNDDQTPEQNPEETSVPTPDETLTPEAIATLRQERDSLTIEITELKESFNLLVKDNLRDLERRKQALTLSVEQLERRQERIKTEMQSTFAGQSQEVAVRVQSFKDYLVGSLQDLALAAEKLELVQTVTPTIDYNPSQWPKTLMTNPPT
jgi:FtsZ-binding cell division protein ZapB